MLISCDNNRLQGSKEAEAKKLIRESGLKIFAYDGLDEAASQGKRDASFFAILLRKERRLTTHLIIVSYVI